MNNSISIEVDCCILKNKFLFFVVCFFLVDNMNLVDSINEGYDFGCIILSQRKIKKNQ